MSNIKQFFKNIGYIGIANIAIAIKGLLLIPLIVKSLGETDFGIWAQLLVTLYLLVPFATLHLGMAFIRFVSAKTDSRDIGKSFSTIFIIVLVWSSILAFAFVISMKFLISNVIDLSDFDGYLVIVGIILPLWSLNIILFSYFRTRLLFRTFTAMTIFHNTADLVLIWGMITYGSGLYDALLGMMFAFLITNLILLAVIVKQVGFSAPDLSFLSKYLAYSLPLVPLELFWWIADSSDKYITGFYLGAFYVGIYAAVYGLSRIVNMFAIPLTFVLGPMLAKYYDSGKLNEVKRLLEIALRIFIMFAVPLVFGFTVLAEPLLLLLATERVSEEGAILVPLITTGMLVYGVSAIFSQIIMLVKKTHVAGIVWGFAAGLNVVLNIVLIPPLGITGPALSTLFTFTFAGMVVIAYSRTHLKFGVDWGFVGKSVAAALVMGVVLWLLLGFVTYTILPTIVLIIIGVAVYFGILFLTRAISQKEREFLTSFVGK